MLDAQGNIGVGLTEHYAILPMASVSGLYFSHPDSHCFAVAKLEREQVEDHAHR